MATYRLDFVRCGQLEVWIPPALPAPPLPDDPFLGLGVPGTRLRITMTLAEPDFVLVEEGDRPVSGTASGARLGHISAVSLTGTPGATVCLLWRVTVRTNEVPSREIELHGLGLNGEPVGLAASAPLDPGLRYTVLHVGPVESGAELQPPGSSGRSIRETSASDAGRWKPVLCLTFGTEIETPDGVRLIEELAPGDLISTFGSGSQPLRWIGSRYVTPAELAEREALRPVEIAAGVLGNRRPLRVSPKHRILLSDWRAQVYFGEDEVLVPARALVNGSSVRQVLPDAGVTYAHLLFDRHEIIATEAALSESFHPEAEGLGLLDPSHRMEIEALFPGGALDRRRAAFPIVRMAEARALRLPE